MFLPSFLQMKVNQRDENWKRTQIANKDESSGKTASLKCIMFINKRQENLFATTLNTKLYVCMSQKETQIEFPTQIENRSDCLNCYEIT